MNDLKTYKLIAWTLKEFYKSVYKVSFSLKVKDTLSIIQISSIS